MFGGNARLGFCIWDIVALIILIIVIVAYVVEARNHRKKMEELEEMAKGTYNSGSIEDVKEETE
ncbi:MAG: hypothetical protein HUJ57_05975 [Erysipelotrichaceae bacterium]|nr:hypothetical protein [Erysipelotrichaceae bacterium]